MKNKNLTYGIIIILIVSGIVFFSFFNNPEQINSEISPREIVEDYFKAWSDKNYEIMYGVISDGFKKIDSNAKDFESFENYASSQNIEEVIINKIEETSNRGETASVSYSVNFILINGNSIPFDGDYTLKYRENDNIPGWKLIHPYGDNIDRS